MIKQDSENGIDIDYYAYDLLYITRTTAHLIFSVRVSPNVVLRLTLSWRRPLLYRNQSIDLIRKSMDWFPYDNGLRHERVKRIKAFAQICFRFMVEVKFIDNP